ncbi:hypothetical protein VCHC17A1_3930, partial [Vibrio cholerae HC-17A1]
MFTSHSFSNHHHIDDTARLGLFLNN